MANYMFILRPTEKVHKAVCPKCAARGEVLDSCSECRGTAIKKTKSFTYYVKDTPININYTDRDPKTGILRYWENSEEFYYETVYPELNKYVPNVPHGIHFCHDTMKSALTECERINKYLLEESRNTAFKFSF